jgi:hypothetical protein
MIRAVPALALVLAGTMAACAQPRQPAGGPPVEHAPRVVDVSPEPFEVLSDLRRPVIIRFDERLSERLEGVREWRDAVIVSPETGEVRVRRGRRHIEVSLAGGWQPGLVYRVEVLPVLRDLFNNVREESVELVFSTGAPVPETALAGFVEDRITGRPVRGARIAATHGEAGHTYVALTDSAGFFALRHVPAGPYEVLGWVDQNRNQVADFGEPQDVESVNLTAADTAVIELQLLARDTTAARLLRAAVTDSQTVELGFDDYFAPGPVDGRARVYRAADSTFVVEGELFHATRLDSLRQADLDAARAEAGQETDPPEDQEEPRRDPRQRPQAQPRAPEAPARGPLPARELILRLPGPLEPETSYFVVVTGVTNIQGVPEGGGRASFRTPAAPDPPPAPAAPPPAPDPAAPPPDPDPDAPPPDGEAAVPPRP